ncbi:MAG: hypothetical protein R3208_14945 [Ketobacteraceae bacterium]|nr:hypothetical protein [Ketobacteraceae bacterium]
MVRTLITLLALIYSSSLLANGYVSADELRSYFKSSEQLRRSAGERLKASRGDPESLKLLQEDDLYFKLPDGNYVKGILLPNGKVSPALTIGGDLIPACVTTENRLIPGQWSGEQQAILCQLAQNEEFAMLESGPRQKSTADQDDSKQEDDPDKLATKYQNGDDRVEPSAPPKAAGEESHRATKYGNPKGNAPSQTASAPSFIYRPPTNRSSSNKTVAGVLERDATRFGIPVGTWIKARLMRPVSSAERGLIEFETKEAVFGKYRDLPAYTVLFAQKYVNEADEKMEAFTVNARLPNGEEIKIEASVHSLDQTAGLHGKLIRDRAGEVMVASTKAALGAIAELTPAGTTTPGRALSDVTETLIDNESRYVPKPPGAVIRVAEQECLLKITKTF